MSEILNLAMPFFGLIVLGVIASRRWTMGDEGLAWLNIFLVYFSLPALIFLAVAKAPFEQLLNWPFVTATTSVTVFVFLVIVAATRWLFATPLKTAALQGTAGSYGNVGYMGLPLAVAFFGPEAAVPAALPVPCWKPGPRRCHPTPRCPRDCHCCPGLRTTPSSLVAVGSPVTLATVSSSHGD